MLERSYIIILLHYISKVSPETVCIMHNSHEILSLWHRERFWLQFHKDL